MRANEIHPSKLVIFDIDDTLVHTQTKVHVVKDGRVTHSLNSHEFTHYKLQPGESFDFGDFANAREFFTNAKPIIPMMNQLKHDIATGNKVVMVTARADFNDRELFLDTFRKYGVDMSKVHVYRAGNMTIKAQTEEKKKIIIRELLNKGHYTKAIMYDDAVPNLESFIELKEEYPHTKFYAWHVSLDGEASEYHRTNEDWNKVNHHDKTDGLSRKAVKAYRREHPGSKLQTAVTTKPGKLKPGSKAAKRRKSFCARMSGNKGPMKKPNGKPTPKALALRRWNCESIEQMAQMIQEGEQMIAEMKQRLDPKCWKGKHKEGTKIKGGIRVNNCVPNESIEKISLVKKLEWPEVVNKVNSVMKAMGWKGKRKDDGAYLFSTKGQETDDQWYMVIIDNVGNDHFNYALGTVEEGDPHIGERDTLPNTEASVSELINAIRDGFGLNESLNEKWSQKYKNSINCSNPKGFSQKAHCAGKKK